MTLFEEIDAFLAAHFPSAIRDDGYDLLLLQGAAQRWVAGGAEQAAIERLCVGRCWATCGNADPSTWLKALRTEAEETWIQRDWDRKTDVTHYAVEFEGAPLLKDFAGLGHGALNLVLISPALRVAFYPQSGSLEAPSPADLAMFADIPRPGGT